MRLLSLHLHTAFRGLPAGFQLDFRPGAAPTYEQLEPICFVGLNGSGKSNVLQVLAEIFAYLETRSVLRGQGKALEKWTQTDHFWRTVGFELDYTLDQFTWSLARSENSDLKDYNHLDTAFPTIKIHKPAKSYMRWDIVYGDKPLWGIDRPRAGYTKAQQYPPLPRHVVGYSSGMNELLSNPFIRLDVHYAEKLLAAQLRSNAPNEKSLTDDEVEEQSQVETETVARNRLIYLDYESNKLIILANFLIQGTKPLHKLYQEARISRVHSFRLTIHYPLHPTTEGNPLQPLELPGFLNQTINRLICCATSWAGDLPEAAIRVRLELNFWVNEATKQAFRHHFYTADNLLGQLYALRLLNTAPYSEKMRDDIKQRWFNENISVQLPRPEPANMPFYVDELQLVKETVEETISYRSLSDGEHQLLHVFGAILLMDQPGTLFLLDEPETHFNPDWRSKFVQILNKVTQDTETTLKREQDVLLTSHSPFIVSDCKPENVFVFKRENGGVGYKRAADSTFTETGAFNTYGASEGLILEVIFGKRDSVSQMVLSIIDRIKAATATLDDVRAGKRELLQLGESIEKFDALNYLNRREKQLLNPTP